MINPANENQFKSFGGEITPTLVIVIQDFTTFKFSWTSIPKASDQRFVLLTSSRHYNTFTNTPDAAFFDDIFLQSDFHHKALCRTISELAVKYGAAAGDILLISNDEDSLGETALTREALGIKGPTYDEVNRFLDKLKMKAALERYHINIPKYIPWAPEQYRVAPQDEISRIERHLGYPIFAKPIASTASMGTSHIPDKSALAAWCSKHQDLAGFELDEFISGTLYHCDSIIKNGDVLFTQVSRYAYPCFDFFSGKICASIQLPSQHEDFAPLAAFTKQVLSALRPIPQNMVTHMEIFRNRQGHLVFLEVAARAPGAQVIPAYVKSLGINFEEINFLLQIGIFQNLSIRRGPYVAWAHIPPKPGRIKRIMTPKILSSFSLDWKTGIGHELDVPKDTCDCAATMLLWNEDFGVLEADFNTIMRTPLFEVSPPAAPFDLTVAPGSSQGL